MKWESITSSYTLNQVDTYFCHMEKAWLSEQGLSFTEKNIAEDRAALDELEEMNVYSTPATLIDGELVVGFDRKRIEQILHALAA